MRLSPTEYYTLTHKDFHFMCKGFFDAKKELQLENWRRLRFQTWWLLKPHAGKDLGSMYDFLPLEGDDALRPKPREYDKDLIKARIREETRK